MRNRRTEQCHLWQTNIFGYRAYTPRLLTMKNRTCLMIACILLHAVVVSAARHPLLVKEPSSSSSNRRKPLQYCTTCANSDNGKLCSSLPLNIQTSIRNALLLNCGGGVFLGVTDQCCNALFQYDWKSVESCLCGGLVLSSIVGLVNPTKVVESCGCAGQARSGISVPAASTSTATASSSANITVTATAASTGK